MLEHPTLLSRSRDRTPIIHFGSEDEALSTAREYNDDEEEEETEHSWLFEDQLDGNNLILFY